jgi:hypothetical protein
MQQAEKYLFNLIFISMILMYIRKVLEVKDEEKDDQ